MIDFRVVLVCAASVSLSLAVGVALGAGPLQGETYRQARARASALDEQQLSLRTQVATLRAGDTYRDTFATEVSPDLVRDKLSGQAVVLVALPDADPRLVTDLSSVLETAGASVTGTVRMRPAWADPTQQQFLANLSARLAGDSARDPGATYDLAGEVLARALVGRKHEPSGRVDDSSATAIGAFGEGGVLTAPPDLPRAELAVVVAAKVPPSPDSSPKPGGPPRTGAASVATRPWSALARALDDAGNGVVVAGGRAAAGTAAGEATGNRRSGNNAADLVAAVRADTAVARAISSVDVADLPSGRIAVVLALAEQLRGEAGQYGAAGSADSALPRPSSP